MSRSEVMKHSSMEEVDTTASEQPNGQQEENEPLLRDPWIRRQKMHCMLMTLLFMLLLGGLGVGAWLIVISGSGGVGPPDAPFEMVNRTAWGAKTALNGTQLRPTRPATHVVIIHTVSAPCLSLDLCCGQVRNIQEMHMRDFHFSDIAYNFLLGGDGRTYEGRGWDVQGAFSRIMNKKALGVAFIGDFEYTKPTDMQLAQAKNFLQEAVARKKLTPDYKLVGHRQVDTTDSPGEQLYDLIKTWPHWEQCYMNTCAP